VHNPSTKTSKHVADKLLSLKDEVKVAKALEVDMKKSHEKILADNKELMKQNKQLDSEVSELREDMTKRRHC